MSKKKTMDGKNELLALRVSKTVMDAIDAAAGGSDRRAQWVRGVIDAALSSARQPAPAVSTAPARAQRSGGASARKPAPGVPAEPASPATAAAAGDGQHAGHRVTANGRNTRAFCETCKKWFDADVDSGQPDGVV